MALDPRIALAGKTPDLGRVFNNALLNLQRSKSIAQNDQLFPIKMNNLLQQQQIGQQRIDTNQFEQGQAEQGAEREAGARKASQLLDFLNNNDLDGAKGNLMELRNLTTQSGGDTSKVDEALGLLNTPQGRDLLKQRSQDVVNQFRQSNQGNQAPSTATRTRQALINDLKSDDPNVVNSAMIELDLKPRPTSAAPQIVDVGGVPHIFDKRSGKLIPAEVGGVEVTTESVAESEAIIEGGIARAKKKATLEEELFGKPRIVRAVKLAEKEATERGDVLTDLSRMEAALPGLKDAMSQLSELAPVATSTLIGRGVNFLIRESGFTVPKGATARAKYISIINNQVLPLLKPTFGAQFTEREGETLKATMGDPNVSPPEKLAQLEAFIAQKERDIRTKQSQLNQGLQNTQDVDLSTLTIEQLMQLKAQSQPPQG